MNPVLFILPTVGILLIAFGTLQQNKSFLEWQIKWRNSNMGIQTKITNASINAGRIGGIISIIAGIVLFLMWYFVILPTYNAILNQ